MVVSVFCKMKSYQTEWPWNYYSTGLNFLSLQSGLTSILFYCQSWLDFSCTCTLILLIKETLALITLFHQTLCFLANAGLSQFLQR